MTGNLNNSLKNKIDIQFGKDKSITLNLNIEIKKNLEIILENLWEKVEKSRQKYQKICGIWKISYYTLYQFQLSLWHDKKSRFAKLLLWSFEAKLCHKNNRENLLYIQVKPEQNDSLFRSFFWAKRSFCSFFIEQWANCSLSHFCKEQKSESLYVALFSKSKRANCKLLFVALFAKS